MNYFNVIENFKEYFKEDDCTEGLATVKCLRDLISKSSANTVKEYDALLNDAVKNLSESDYCIAPIISASELFMRYITFCKLDANPDDYKEIFLKKADIFINKISKGADVISNLCENILHNNSRILIYGGSKLVWEVLSKYLKRHPRLSIKIYIIGSTKDNYKKRILKYSNPDVTFEPIDYSALAYYMRNMDCVLYGAEAVVGSGGIINEMGTENVAIVADSYRVPFYVLTESIRMTRLFPLSLTQVPPEYKYKSSVRCSGIKFSELAPDVDFTRPHLIRLIVTDIGYFPAASVSEELLKLYL